MRAVSALLRAAGGQLICVRPLYLCIPANKLVQFNLSDIGEGIREVTVRNWFVKENDVVSQFDNICEVESDKATVSITSRYDGKITKLYHNIGDIALVGKPLVDIDVDDASDTVEVESENVEVSDVKPSEHSDAAQEEISEDYSEKNWNKSLATPAVRRIAMEHKIKLSDVKGSGKNGRVMKEDILAYVSNLSAEGNFQKMSTVSLTPVQRVMTRTMTESSKIPQFVFSDEIDVSKLVKLRSEAKEAASKKNINLTYLPFFIKAISKGLSQYPLLNSSFDLQREQIIYKEHHNIGIAVDTPSGLVVPNVKSVQNLSVIQIAKELNRLQELAAKNKLAPDDLKGGTFSVSNIGIIGGTTATPLILPPEVAIVALGKIQRLPRFDPTGSVRPSDILFISWSADHRILDGATVARCSEVFKYYLQNPSSLLLDL